MGVVVYTILYAVFLYNTTPIRCTPPLMNLESPAFEGWSCPGRRVWAKPRLVGGPWRYWIRCLFSKSRLWNLKHGSLEYERGPTSLDGEIPTARVLPAREGRPKHPRSGQYCCSLRRPWIRDRNSYISTNKYLQILIKHRYTAFQIIDVYV